MDKDSICFVVQVHWMAIIFWEKHCRLVKVLGYEASRWVWCCGNQGWFLSWLGFQSKVWNGGDYIKDKDKMKKKEKKGPYTIYVKRMQIAKYWLYLSYIWMFTWPLTVTGMLTVIVLLLTKSKFVLRVTLNEIGISNDSFCPCIAVCDTCNLSLISIV